jgi:hypothetical protein
MDLPRISVKFSHLDLRRLLQYTACTPKLRYSRKDLQFLPIVMPMIPDFHMRFGLLSLTSFHAPHALLALKHDKHYLLESRTAIKNRDADSVIKPESLSKGNDFVGYIRRYTPRFLRGRQ